MAKPPVKSESRRIQKQHLRKYGPNKITVVNRGVEHPTIPRPTRLQYEAKVKTLQKVEEQASQTPKVILRPKIRPTEQESKDVDKWAENTAAALTFPTIAYTGGEGWYPEPMKQQAQMARLIQLMKTQKGLTDEPFEEYATDEEALGYISSASLVGPPSSEMAHIMGYLFTKVMDPSKVTPDLKVTELPPDEMELLKKLKRSIRESQWKAWRTQKKQEEQ